MHTALYWPVYHFFLVRSDPAIDAFFWDTDLTTQVRAALCCALSLRPRHRRPLLGRIPGRTGARRAVLCCVCALLRLCAAVLCAAVLCCALLCAAVLCCALLCCAVLCYAVL